MDVRVPPLLRLDVPPTISRPKLARRSTFLKRIAMRITWSLRRRSRWITRTAEHGDRRPNMASLSRPNRHESIVLMPFATASHSLRKNDLIERFDPSLRFDSPQGLTVWNFFERWLGFTGEEWWIAVWRVFYLVFIPPPFFSSFRIL